MKYAQFQKYPVWGQPIVFQSFGEKVLFIVGFTTSTKTFSWQAAELWTPDGISRDGPTQAMGYNSQGKQYIYVAIG